MVNLSFFIHIAKGGTIMAMQNVLDAFSRHWHDSYNINIVNHEDVYKFTVGSVELDMKKGMDAFSDKWFSLSYARTFLSDVE